MWPSALRMRFHWFPHSGKTRMTTHMWRWPGSCAGTSTQAPYDNDWQLSRSVPTQAGWLGALLRIEEVET
jgi:hypothetical protein